MIRLAIKTNTAPLKRRLEKTRTLLSDLRWLFDAVSRPWWLAHGEANFATQGRHSGQNWSFGGEPKYARYKAQVAQIQDPLRWAIGREQIYPSLTDPSHPMHVWRATPDAYIIGSTAPNFENVRRAGTGPFGESYPARDPLFATPAQLAELARTEQAALNARLSELGWEVN